MISMLAKQDEEATKNLLTEILQQLEDHLYREKRRAIYKVVLTGVEKSLIERMLEHTEGNQLKAARILGINRNTMRAKIKKLEIDINKWKG